MIDRIATIDDAVTFSKQLLDEGTNFHPDDDFTTYINTDTGESSYTTSEAEVRNDLMEQAFDVCEQKGVDIYNLTMEVYLKETGLDQFIPLPPQ
jgi:hypothetical protein